MYSFSAVSLAAVAKTHKSGEAVPVLTAVTELYYSRLE